MSALVTNTDETLVSSTKQAENPREHDDTSDIQNLSNEGYEDVRFLDNDHCEDWSANLYASNSVSFI